MREHGMSGVIRAPQFGIPRVLTVREVKQRKITPGELTELSRLLQELDRRDLAGVIRR